MANFIDKSLVLKWAGESVKIDITNDLCNSLEENGINLFDLYIKISKGGTPPLFLVGKLITSLLQYSGVAVTQEDIMPQLTSEPATAVSLCKFVGSFLRKAIPQPDDKDMGKPSKAKAKK